MKLISQVNQALLVEAAKVLKRAEKAVALTGAGISVGCGISDFRSPGGLWTKFSPDEYATFEVFQRNPAKAWELYRALGKTLIDKKSGPAHKGLADLERMKLIKGIVTQNVDNLHQQAGSSVVFEIHGDHLHLQCLDCGCLEPVCNEHYSSNDVPKCCRCGFSLKPNVVLFGEPVRRMDEIEKFVGDCDLLMVIGTSAQVYPAAAIPAGVKHHGGIIMEFNREQALDYDHFTGISTMSDYFFQGDVENTLPMFCEAVGNVL